MKTRETKQKDLVALTESLQNSTSAMVVSFTKLSVTKDQEFRNSLREAGAEYQVVKNTLARIAVKGTQFEPATEHFKGVTAIAWTNSDPVILTKAISKFMKENADTYTFKTGVLDGRVLDLSQVSQIASLPSKEELMSKLLFVLNAQAQRIVTVINAVPRDLAIVIKQIGDAKPSGGEATAEATAEEPAAAPEVAAPAEQTEASEPVADTDPVEESTPVTEVEASAPATEAAPEEASTEEAAPAVEIEAAPAEEVTSEETSSPEPAVTSESQAEATAAEPDEKAEELLSSTPTGDTEGGAEAIAAEPEVAAEEMVASNSASDTEVGAEAAVAAPDDKAEELLNAPEADAEDRA